VNFSEIVGGVADNVIRSVRVLMTGTVPRGTLT
jgi:hypothetical protein